jgi:hypothetical protein
MTPPCVSPCLGHSTPWIPLSGSLRLGTIALDCLLSTLSGQSVGVDEGLKLNANLTLEPLTLLPLACTPREACGRLSPWSTRENETCRAPLAVG